MAFLPTTKQEIEQLGWDVPDFVLVTGDAYVDHPTFGVAIISRLLESYGYKIAILAQPDWRTDRDFTRFGDVYQRQPILVMVARSGTVSVATPGPPYSMIFPTPVSYTHLAVLIEVNLSPKPEAKFSLRNPE